jgi:hypothetical protein
MTAPHVTPEFSRPIEIRRIPATGSVEHLHAEAAELPAIAKRLDVQACKSLTARLHVLPWRGGGLRVTGGIKAELTRQSVISLQIFDETSEYEVDRYFVPASQAAPDPDSDDSDDIDVLSGETLDLGEIVLEAVGLDLDPYPRMPDESFSGFSSESTTSDVVKPFADLSSFLKKRK